MTGVGVKLDGLKELNGKLKKLRRKYGGEQDVSVSFGTDYAIYVHENLEAHHTTGEAKYLEKAVLRNIDAAQSMIEKRTQSTNLGLAMYTAGLLIQREAQKLTPVDTGQLKASARTQMEART